MYTGKVISTNFKVLLQRLDKAEHSGIDLEAHHF
jgi:hypothetical protein